MTTPIRRAIYGALAGDGVLTSMLGPSPAGYTWAIYHQGAPEGAAYPLVVFSKSSGLPTETFHEPSAYETDIWLIKAIDKARSADPAEAIADRLNTLLNDASLSISGSTLMCLRRQSDVDYPEVTNGVAYNHCGALYRLIYESP